MRKVILFCLLLTLSLCACSSAKETAKTDLESTLTELCIGDPTQAMLYTTGSLIADELSNRDGESDLHRKIRGYVRYEIDSVVIEADTAQAELTIQAPNMLQILQNHAETSNNVDALLAAVHTTLDSGDMPQITFELTVMLRQVDGHWYLVPNTALSNALSGGLLDRYAEILQSVMEGGAA